MFTLFYAYLLPLGTVLSCGSLIIVYAVEKILIVKRNSKPPPTGSEMIEEMVDFYGELVLLVFSVFIISLTLFRVVAVCGNLYCTIKYLG